MPVTYRLDSLQQRHRWIGFPIAVIYKYLDDQGGYLAALIAYYAFLSTFPLLLLSSTVLGWVLADNPDVQRRILDTALSQFPVIGDQLSEPEQLSGGVLGVGTRIAVLTASVAINTTALVVAFRIATTRTLTIKQVAPGAITAAIGWQLLQTFGATYVGHVIQGASATNAVFALVLGMLAFFYITATLIVLCAVINTVRVDQLHPRALLTPFTDNVDLTDGDRRAYAAQAEAQGSKGFENVNVTFGTPPHRDDDTPSVPSA